MTKSDQPDTDSHELQRPGLTFEPQINLPLSIIGLVDNICWLDVIRHELI